MDTREFESRLEEATKIAGEAVLRHLPEEAGQQSRLTEAMNYSITAGGKRLRPILMLETYKMCGGCDGELIGFFMAAIEMIHTYSLVHDDLPAMDNDRYRRGRETTWYVYGDAMGILAGDGLLNYAFETALKAPEYCLKKDDITNEEKLEISGRIWRALSVLSRKAGIYGMIGGQAVDIMTQGREDEELLTETLLFIHEHKTAALIEAAMMTGAILAGAGERQIQEIEKCAGNIGLAFQIQDDILDVTSSQEVLGKPVLSDEKNGKNTYVALYGMEQAKQAVKELSEEAVLALESLPGDHEFMRQLIMMLVTREK